MTLLIDSPLQIGDVVGRYRVESFVAEGGMGRVFRAWDTRLERPVALKTIRADHANDRAALSMWGAGWMVFRRWNGRPEQISRSCVRLTLARSHTLERSTK